LVTKQIPALPIDNILLEPMRKNTGPCVAYFSHKVHSINPNGLAIIAPSDHLILKETAYYQAKNVALQFAANNDALITIGLMPTRPDTGYGYIQFDENKVEDNVFKVKTFTEKPNLEIAKEFIKSGDFLWNSGMFVWSVKSIMKAMDLHQQEMHQAFYSIKQHYNTTKEAENLQKAYEHCNNISIDYAIMEKAKNVYVVPANIGWSDLGTWSSLYEESPKDYWQNVCKSDNVMLYEADNNIIVSDNKKLVVVQGLSNYIVVDTPDVLMICSKNNEQQIKEITHDIKDKKQEKFL
jgi:mannose-1-phosphate guanylyltransferase